MAELYRQLAAGGGNAEALREAMLETRVKYSNPVKSNGPYTCCSESRTSRLGKRLGRRKAQKKLRWDWVPAEIKEAMQSSAQHR